MPELLERSIGWLASGAAFVLLGALGFSPGPAQPRSWRQMMLHPIRYRIRTSDAVGKVVAPLAQISSYLYVWGLVSIVVGLGLSLWQFAR